VACCLHVAWAYAYGCFSFLFIFPLCLVISTSFLVRENSTFGRVIVRFNPQQRRGRGIFSTLYTLPVILTYNVYAVFSLRHNVH
jgi:hypothetical protein